MQQSKRYSTIDVLKFIFAYVIVIHHVLYMNEYHWYYSEKIIPTIVAFFFSVSGFFLYKKINNDNKHNRTAIKKYFKRIVILYSFWSLVLFVFRIPEIYRIGLNFKGQLVYLAKYLRVILFIGEYQLWYLVGLLWILIVFAILLRKGKLRWNIIAAISFWITHFIIDNIHTIGNNCIGEKVLLLYKLTGNTTRNGLLTGYIFFILGCVIAKYEKEIKQWIRKSVARSVLLIASTVFLTSLYLFFSHYFVILIVEPIIVSLLLIIGIIFYFPAKTRLISDYSSIVFLGHMFFILIVLNTMSGINTFLQMAIVLLCVTLFTIVFERLSRKFIKIKNLF